MEISERDREAHVGKKELPSWVKCSKCQQKPTWTNWLMEIVPNSNALICQNCVVKV